MRHTHTHTHATSMSPSTCYQHINKDTYTHSHTPLTRMVYTHHGITALAHVSHKLIFVYTLNIRNKTRYISPYYCLCVTKQKQKTTAFLVSGKTLRDYVQFLVCMYIMCYL